MRKTQISKKQKATIVGGTVAALVMGGAAFAYWTTTGTGSGSATTGTTSNFVVTTDAATGGPLTPGGPSETVTFHVQNTNTGVQRLQAVAVTVANSDGSAWASVPGCSASDYTIGTPTFTAGDIAPGGTTSGTVTITMNNTASNQNGCKGATVPLYVSAS